MTTMFKKIALSLASLTLLGGSAFAAVPMNGTVRSYNAEARVITFENGKSATIPLDVAVPANLKAGEHASLDFDHGRVDSVFTGALL